MKSRRRSLGCSDWNSFVAAKKTSVASDVVSVWPVPSRYRTLVMQRMHVLMLIVTELKATLHSCSTVLLSMPSKGSGSSSTSCVTWPPGTGSEPSFWYLLTMDIFSFFRCVCVCVSQADSPTEEGLEQKINSENS